MRAILNAYPVSKLATGMYFTINGDGYNATWMVAGYGALYNFGNNIVSGNGWMLIPRVPLFNDTMNAEATTAGGYAGSTMHTVTLSNYGNTLKNILGDTLQLRDIVISNSVDMNASSSGYTGMKGCSNDRGWAQVYCSLPTEVQIFGTTIWGNAYDVGDGCFKLPVFNFINHVHYDRWSFWLRAVANTTNYSIANYNGYAYCNHVRDSRGVRPLIYVA